MIDKLFSFDDWDEVDGPMTIQIYEAKPLRNFGKFQLGNTYSCVAFLFGVKQSKIECYDSEGDLLFTQEVELVAK